MAYYSNNMSQPPRRQLPYQAPPAGYTQTFIPMMQPNMVPPPQGNYNSPLIMMNHYTNSPVASYYNELPNFDLMYYNANNQVPAPMIAPNYVGVPPPISYQNPFPSLPANISAPIQRPKPVRPVKEARQARQVKPPHSQPNAPARHSPYPPPPPPKRSYTPKRAESSQRLQPPPATVPECNNNESTPKHTSGPAAFVDPDVQPAPSSTQNECERVEEKPKENVEELGDSVGAAMPIYNSHPHAAARLDLQASTSSNANIPEPTQTTAFRAQEEPATVAPAPVPELSTIAAPDPVPTKRRYFTYSSDEDPGELPYCFNLLYEEVKRHHREKRRKKAAAVTAAPTAADREVRCIDEEQVPLPPTPEPLQTPKLSAAESEPCAEDSEDKPPPSAEGCAQAVFVGMSSWPFSRTPTSAPQQPQHVYGIRIRHESVEFRAVAENTSLGSIATSGVPVTWDQIRLNSYFKGMTREQGICWVRYLLAAKPGCNDNLVKWN
ncbi:uncharacterized protein GGS25DRAFT_526500 [Hypoxylon fragiforme]|uniref:uncharacterized protein n=1 Tax=Hypoxylon fragiforme TaxID=63214 RepID=UPI0020C7355D|nr:uncharacterized protein GGS25DRAFT_526500 [Hypoxylon fragiforme]KAI2603461.1 hypothetical protein GGS25DRAFT_526500 [Hypoxylon fragiforme]